jgi:hypothetical protein
LTLGEPGPVRSDRIVGLLTWARGGETTALHARQGSVTTFSPQEESASAGPAGQGWAGGGRINRLMEMQIPFGKNLLSAFQRRSR